MGLITQIIGTISDTPWVILKELKKTNDACSGAPGGCQKVGNPLVSLSDDGWLVHLPVAC